jgi:hypothetical protein
VILDCLEGEKFPLPGFRVRAAQGNLNVQFPRAVYFFRPKVYFPGIQLSHIDPVSPADQLHEYDVFEDSADIFLPDTADGVLQRMIRQVVLFGCFQQPFTFYVVAWRPVDDKGVFKVTYVVINSFKVGVSFLCF